MNSFKMKALAVAVVGLAGLGMMGSAFGQSCPTSAVAPTGAWDSQSVTGSTLAIVGGSAGGGLDGTNCKLSLNVNAGAQVNAKAFVSNTTGPLNEPRYRARFYVETTGLTGLTVANRQTYIFSAQALTSPAAFGLAEVNGFVAGGSPPSFAFLVADANQANGYQQVTVPFPDNAGEYRVEFDLQQGSSTGANCNSVTPTGGCFRYWISDAGTATADATPTGTIAVANSGWGGVSRFNLGLSNISQQFRSNVTSQILSVDEFDSRRQTFIGQ
jgi:hypothetical protein